MTTQQITESAPKKNREPKPLNGVDVPTLFATLDAVKAQPELAHFRFRATNRWISGTHSVSRMGAFDGAGGQHTHKATYELDSDHPAVLVGADDGPTPVEYVLHALASCLMAGIGNISAARGVELESVTAEIEGFIDLNGLLGLKDEVRRGYQGIKVRFDIRGNGTPEQLRDIVERSRGLSAVFDIITNQVPVEIEVDAA